MHTRICVKDATPLIPFKSEHMETYQSICSDELGIRPTYIELGQLILLTLLIIQFSVVTDEVNKNVKDTSFFINLNCCHVTFKTNNFPNQLTMTDTNLEENNTIIKERHIILS